MKKQREQEKRFLDTTLEAASETTFTGCAARYDKDSQYMGFIESLAPGCFEKTLQENRNIRATFNHDQDAVLGTLAAKTLQLESRDDGLYFTVDIPDTTHGRDTLQLVKRGDIRGCSFIMYVIKDEWRYDDQMTPYRRILEAKLTEISLVIDPAYLDTEVEARTMPEDMKPAAHRDTTQQAGQPVGPDHGAALYDMELAVLAAGL